VTVAGPWSRAEHERLPRSFFDRPSAQVAPELLGCVLWTACPAGLVAVRLVEVEAYEGLADPASHAFRGRTPRNAVMFGPPGYLYVYFTYGMHFCANLVCMPEEQPSAVLLRAGQVVAGTDLAASRRDHGGNGRARANGRPASAVDLARGPARLCQALGIDRAADGADACTPGGLVGIGPSAGFHDAVPVAPAQIMTGPRVGVSQAADRPLRYWVAGDRHVSVYRASKPRQRKPVAGREARDGTMLR
jgi:DNA-3-methyladenine glycosylase